MNTIVFRIFGAPTTFNLYNGSGNEIGYFQNFDDGSKENVKLTIHRMSSGMVSYSYLRYNFISSGGRPNSFFGMSVLFDNEYCKDIEKIFELFDTVYNSIIVKNGILLTQLNDNNKAQAKYAIRVFSDAEAEVKNIENNILNNLRSHFINDVLPLNNSFIESNSMSKLNDKMGNLVFNNALKRCSWVSISSSYSNDEDPIPNPEFIAGLDAVIENVQKQMPIISVRALKKENVQKTVSQLLESIDMADERIFTWLQKEYPKDTNRDTNLRKQPDLKQRHEKFLEIKSPLSDLLKVVEANPISHATNNSFPNSKNSTYPYRPAEQSVDSPFPKLPFWTNPKFIAGGVLAIIIVVCVIVFVPNKKGGGKVANNTTVTTDKKVVDSDSTVVEKDLESQKSPQNQGGTSAAKSDKVSPGVRKEGQKIGDGTSPTKQQTSTNVKGGRQTDNDSRCMIDSVICLTKLQEINTNLKTSYTVKDCDYAISMCDRVLKSPHATNDEKDYATNLRTRANNKKTNQ